MAWATSAFKDKAESIQPHPASAFERLDEAVYEMYLHSVMRRSKRFVPAPEHRFDSFIAAVENMD